MTNEELNNFAAALLYCVSDLRGMGRHRRQTDLLDHNPRQLASDSGLGRKLNSVVYKLPQINDFTHRARVSKCAVGVLLQIASIKNATVVEDHDDVATAGAALKSNRCGGQNSHGPICPT